MASTAESRYQQPRYGNNQANGGGSAQGQSYVLYPDAPQVPQPTPRKKPQQQDHQQQQQPQRSHGDLTPQSSYSSTSSSHHNRSPAPSRGNSGSNGINIAGASPKIKQSQLNYLNSPAVFSTSPSAAAPPSPISPSSPSPIEIMTGHLGRTHLEEPVLDRLQFESYDQKQYQQPRKNSGNSSTQQQHQQQRHQQLAQENESYSSGGLKQSGSTGSARSMGSQGRDQNGALRQSPSSGSAYSVGSSGQTPSQRQQQRAMNGELNKSGSSASAHSVASSRSHNLSPSHSTGSATSNSPSSHMRQQQSSSTRGAPTSTPSPLAYDHDQGDDKERGDNEDHQKQAFQYQQKLQQKPPSTHGGEDDSDDSDSGSMLSYRRSISRLSMSYKRTQGGAPNISLFAPKQRAAMLQGSQSSELSSSQKMIQDQRDERLRQQKLQQYSNSNSQSGNNSSMASIDQYPRQDEGRPSMNRNHSGGNNNQQQYQGGSPQIPDRSTSTEHLGGGNGRPRQQQQQQSYPGNGRGHPSSPNIAERQLSNHQHSQQQYSQQPRSNHDQGQGQSSQRSRPNQLNLGQGDHQQDQRSRSPMPSGARTPGLPGQGSTMSSNGGGNGGVYRQNGPPGSGGGFSNSSTSLPLPPSRSNNNNNSGGPNLHPAHHLASGGYVRPEEAMGPSNPMPEKAEDFVRQGIEYHEVGDIAKATHFFRTAAEMGDPVGMLMYGLSVRHGWGCSSNRQLAFQYLQKSAEHAVGDLKSRDSFASTAAKGELVLAIYELGICFRHGWGADKNKKTAAYYFEIAANLGDPDAQNDLAWCYYHGVGVKKDMFKAAKYYRLAAAQGLETVGNSWIWKDKYGGMPSSPTGDSKAPF
ncbi:hypothetical protein EC957_006243 [Mortierella hygrophila]|uniref:Uncharacterized protein n=1 Tax=Mortierella hygrophila TaxID=979708 RepID=A0A9P6JZ32_9FUNG|nr:hypothetical protein EC957_006243 [Mortierella hygrophila]